MHRYLAFVGALAVVVTAAQGQVTAQAPVARANTTSIKKAWTLSRTPDGQPDLQGVWANNNATPLERPTVLAGRTTLTNEEVEALKKKAGELFNGDGDAAFGDEIFRSVLESVKAGQSAPYQKAPQEIDFGTGDYNSFWIVERDWDNRTSLITDPPNGRLPPMTPEGNRDEMPEPPRGNALPRARRTGPWESAASRSARQVFEPVTTATTRFCKRRATWSS